MLLGKIVVVLRDISNYIIDPQIMLTSRTIWDLDQKVHPFSIQYAGWIQEPKFPPNFLKKILKIVWRKIIKMYNSRL